MATGRECTTSPWADKRRSAVVAASTSSSSTSLPTDQLMRASRSVVEAAPSAVCVTLVLSKFCSAVQALALQVLVLRVLVMRRR